jgi:hypothetical protein
MPKSRKRRPKRSGRDHRTAQRRTSRPYSNPREDARDLALLQAADDAERRGDAMEALATMAAHPDGLAFWRPWRVRALGQIAMFGPLLPRWATSRWILAQALQHLGLPGGVANRRVHRALEQAIELRGGRDRLPGRDPLDAVCKVMDHDWVFRQLHLYELGGLRYFLDRVAAPDLVSGADRIRDWATTPMGGFRLLERAAGTIAWQDLALGEPVSTANIGTATLVVPGDCVIGRMVPIEAGAMFESAPLIVPEDVAFRVARDMASWIDALRSIPGGTASPGILRAGDTSGLLSDVPTPVWLLALSEAGGLTDVAAAPTPDQLAKATLTLAHAAVGGSWQLEDDEIEPWSCLAAALVSPALAGAMVGTVTSADRDVLAWLGELLAEPAASWCRELAAMPTRAA